MKFWPWFRSKHWLKVASTEWRFVQVAAREDMQSMLAACKHALAAARNTKCDQNLTMTEEMDTIDGSELLPQGMLTKNRAPLQLYRNEYSFRLLHEWEGAAAFSIRQAKFTVEKMEDAINPKRQEEALNKCIVAWTENGLKEAWQWWMSECYRSDHMPTGCEGPVQSIAKLHASVMSKLPDGNLSEAWKEVGFSSLLQWFAEKKVDVSCAALPLLLTMEPTYEFNAWNFNETKKTWLTWISSGFAWALIGDAAAYETLTLTDGSNYKGQHRNGKPHGHGEQTWADGKLYKGEFRNGVPHGFGTMIWQDGDQLESLWRNGRSRGVGTMTLEDGTWYRGKFRFGKKHGKWIMCGTDGSQVVRQYILGKCISTSVNS